MKTIVFTYGKFSNNSDLHRLLVALSTQYTSNQEFTLCEYNGFQGEAITINNPLYVSMDDRGYAFKVETEPTETLEEIIENVTGNLVIVTNFVDYKDDLLNHYISENIVGKKINFIYYDEKNREVILKENKYVGGINESIKFEQMNRLAKKCRIVLKGNKL